jgi:hypothetical protein
VQCPTLKTAIVGWPDPKFLGEDSNFPAVFFTETSEKGKNIVSRRAVHKIVDNHDGTGQIVREVLRLYYLLTITLFTNTPESRASIGWGIKQYLVTNYRLIMADGESAMFKYGGDHQSEKPDIRRYQRDLTFTVQARVLAATAANKVTEIIPDFNITT